MGEATLRGDPDFEFDAGGLGELSCIDLNTAMTFDLERLMHIGEARAEEIIEGRPWEGVESLILSTNQIRCEQYSEFLNYLIQ